MNSKKVFFIMLGVTGLMALLVVGAVVAGDKLLKAESQKLVDLKLENEVIELQKTSLAQAKKDIDKYTELEAIAQQVVPQEKDQAVTVRELVAIADASGIKISSISFPSSNLGATAPAAKKTSDSSSSSSSKKTATPPITQAQPVTGIDGLYKVDINIVSDTSTPATYSRLIDFLDRLEQNRRTAQVSQISIQPDAANRTRLNFNLTVTVYIKP